MRGALFVAAMICAHAGGAVVLDRIAVTVGTDVIKDSDIVRDIRVTSFLNGEPLSITPESRRKAAERLIDQELIRNEAEVGRYTEATKEDVDKLLAQIRSSRFPSEDAFRSELKRYGLTEEQLRNQLRWQLNVLNFIEQRFRPGVLVSDEDVEKFFQENRAKLQQTAGSKPLTLDDAREQIVEQIAGERVNQQFFDWLERARRRANVRYREAALK